MVPKEIPEKLFNLESAILNNTKKNLNEIYYLKFSSFTNPEIIKN